LVFSSIPIQSAHRPFLSPTIHPDCHQSLCFPVFICRRDCQYSLSSPTHFRCRHIAPPAAESYIVCRTRGLKSQLFTYLFPQHPPTSAWSQHCSTRCCYSSKSIPSCCLVATWSCLVAWGVPASTITITTTISPTCAIRSVYVRA
jgi:hypothetical protein